MQYIEKYLFIYYYSSEIFDLQSFCTSAKFSKIKIKYKTIN